VTYVIDRAAVDRLIDRLRDEGFTVIGPTVRAEAVVLDEIESTGDFPVGVGDEQEAGHYRLVARAADTVFGAVVGPGSVKRFLHPPEAPLLRFVRNGAGFSLVPPDEAPRYAFVGVRPCDLAAVAIQDRVFLGGKGRDATYGSRRDGAVFVVANCVRPGGTCFCTSMGTGPRASTGFDVALTEVVDGSEHWFLAESGSDFGEDLLGRLGVPDAGSEAEDRVDELLEAAAGAMGRTLDADGLAEALRESLDSPRWDQIAARCLTCANCTLVCPTCFCASVDDETSLTGEEAVRIRRWDSCFNEEHSYIHGGPLRPSPSARYRQWLTHKLSSWVAQFGSMGCVGCGRCITWCPVGIDITVEAEALREEVAHV
jgi:ferredoxin